jgi:hypothetical protein
MMNRNENEQMQNRNQSSSSLPTGRQNENFGVAVKPDMTTRGSQKF